MPLYVVGFNGQLDCLLLRWLLRRQPTPIVFAPLVTLTETLVDDRGVFGARSLRARLAGAALDRASLSAATPGPDRHRRAPAVRDPDVRSAAPSACQRGTSVPTRWSSNRRRPRDRRGAVRVLFYGTFLPLHGVRTILAAAARLRDQPGIEFVLVGDGPERAASVAYARNAGLQPNRLPRLGRVRGVG